LGLHARGRRDAVRSRERDHRAHAGEHEQGRRRLPFTFAPTQSFTAGITFTSSKPSGGTAGDGVSVAFLEGSTLPGAKGGQYTFGFCGLTNHGFAVVSDNTSQPGVLDIYQVPPAKDCFTPLVSINAINTTDGKSHTLEVSWLAPGTVTATLDGTYVASSKTGALPLSGPIYFGASAGTGDWYSKQSVGTAHLEQPSCP
jgi:hypothetical protein